MGFLTEAKVISWEDSENVLEKSKTCLVFVKNLPEAVTLSTRVLGNP